ncbi:MAG: hypothetical protein K0U86_07475 [Planctomycetes bacterium]|nr:hypothetical protein [Planctomycetota bacterium]MCH9724728.1 hypothetical protein [Planctomycetota bacterium]MCH9778826.1 hypothetical protein [Planctomycetota bacterium]MCH9790427.1 hypothetical protein [Planctomycetota bacterium]
MSSGKDICMLDLYLKFDDGKDAIAAEAKVNNASIELYHKSFYDPCTIIRILNSTSLCTRFCAWWHLSTGGPVDVLAQDLNWIEDEAGITWIRFISLFTSDLIIYIRPSSDEDWIRLNDWVEMVKGTH